MNRREAILAAVGGVSGAACQDLKQQRQRPWNEITLQRLEQDGHWADYVAWEMWMDRESSSFFDPGSAFNAEDFLGCCRDEGDKIFLYSLMCKLADGE